MDSDGRVDCGFLRLPTHPDLKTIFLEQDRLLAICRKTIRWQSFEHFPVSSLCDYPFYASGKGCKG
jgi:hypothetical protein